MRIPLRVFGGLLIVLLVAAWGRSAGADTKHDPFPWTVRPALSGPVSTFTTEDGVYKIHWTEEGEDALGGAADGDGNGLPDGVDRVVYGLELGTERFLDEGWRPLVGDDGKGGGPEIDLYLHSIPANGYATSQDPGDPSVPGHSCYMEIDNGLGASAAGIVESVTVHELHHCVQYRYAVGVDPWLYEATATYEQYKHVSSPVLDVAVQALWYDRLSYPGRGLAGKDGRYEYAGLTLLKFWSEQPDRDLSRLPELWEIIAFHPSSWRKALNLAAESHFDRGLNDTALDYLVWMAEQCPGPENLDPDDTILPCTLLENPSPVTELGPDSPELHFRHDLPSHNAGYWSVPAEGSDLPVELSCSGPGPGAGVFLRMTEQRSNGEHGQELTVRLRNEGTARPRFLDPIDPDGAVLITLLSTGTEPADMTCTMRRVERLSFLGGCNVPGSSSRIAAPLVAVFVVLRLLPRRRMLD